MGKVNISSLQRNEQPAPLAIFVYGVNGIGKTTFCDDAPNPVFLCPERGLRDSDSPAFHVRKLNQFYEMCASLRDDDHDFSDLCIDSADWLDDLILSEIRARHPQTELAYGRETTYVRDEWVRVLGALDEVRDIRGMQVIFTGHPEKVKESAPETPEWDKLYPRMSKVGRALLCDWSDIVIYAFRRVAVTTEKGGFGKVSVIAKTMRQSPNSDRDTNRVMGINDTAAYFAKQGYDMQDLQPFDYDGLMNAYFDAIETRREKRRQRRKQMASK